MTNPQFDAALQRSTLYLETFAERVNETNTALSRGGTGVAGFGGGARGRGGAGPGNAIPLGGLSGALAGAGPAGLAGSLALNVFDRTVGFAANAVKRQANQFAKRTAFGFAENLTFNAISDHGSSARAALGNAAQDAARKVPFLGFAFNRRLAPIDRAISRTQGQLSGLVRAGGFSNEDGSLNTAAFERAAREQLQPKLAQEKRIQESQEVLKKLKSELGLKAQDDINSDLGKLTEAVKNGVVAAFKEAALLNFAPLASATARATIGGIG